MKKADNKTKEDIVEAHRKMKKSSRGYVLSRFGGLTIIVCGFVLAIAGIGSYAGALVIIFAILGGILLLSGIIVVNRAAARSRVVIVFAVFSLLFSYFPTALGIGSLASWRPEMGDRTFYIFLLLLGFVSAFGSILSTIGGVVLIREKR